MDTLVKNGKHVLYRMHEYVYHDFTIVDELCIHLHLDDGIYAVTLPCIINQIQIDTIEQFEEVFK